MAAADRARWSPGVPVGLVLGGLFGAAALTDRATGWAGHPQLLLTLTYAALAIAVLMALAGIRSARAVSPHRVLPLLLVLAALTAGYVRAVRAGADVTPWVLQGALDRGDALMHAGRTDEAHLVYREAHQRFPRAFPVLMRLGSLNYVLTDFDRARRYYEQGLEVSPPESRWRALNDLAQTYWKLLRPEDAIRRYWEADEAGIPPSDRIDWHYRLAWAYFDAGDYDAAMEHYDVVARSGGRYAASSHYNIACALAQKMKRAPDQTVRLELAESAVDHLRSAWREETDPTEREALRTGVTGPIGDRDPELFPLRSTAVFRALLTEIR